MPPPRSYPPVTGRRHHRRRRDRDGDSRRLRRPARHIAAPRSRLYSKATALLIAGSGATDPNGSGPYGGPDTLRHIARQLARCGVASLRYDKRGIGQSQFKGLNESDLTFDDFVNDATTVASALLQQDDVDELWLVGHSEGALIALAAQEKVQAQRVVLLAASAQRYLDLIERQLAPNLNAPQREQIGATVRDLRAGATIDAASLPTALAPLLRASVQPFLCSADRF